MQSLSLTQPTSVIKPNSNHPLKIIALGDSLIYGFGDPVGGGWVERLRRRWMCPDQPGPVLYNLGIRGNRIVQVAARLEAEFLDRGEIKNSLPDLMILSVGVNDSARLGREDGRCFTEIREFHRQLDLLLERARRLCPVIFVGMIPVNEVKMPFLDCFYFNHRDQYAYKEVTKKACQERGIPYLDIFDLWLSRGEIWLKTRLSSDGLHPNSQGYQDLLEDILSWEGMEFL
ncbi:GDSL-type esterase/lipase family protein [Gloeocapsa sp. PCC 73106]|uniref:GDSL-type esterase/lipase family protein n=1 Tax=Gloeocapsa sp. PCC 73106 TaxID=102232 RepID=UPI0002AD1902|nr:GDSL-type esterase/lipase family protein [Gloeocapsa sp. PCC 73106]ELR97390.1 lysophospholipase L1-like esterase [Gloeocapsa sp. PCC 73106]